MTYDDVRPLDECCQPRDEFKSKLATDEDTSLTTFEDNIYSSYRTLFGCLTPNQEFGHFTGSANDLFAARLFSFPEYVCSPWNR